MPEIIYHTIYAQSSFMLNFQWTCSTPGSLLFTRWCILFGIFGVFRLVNPSCFASAGALLFSVFGAFRMLFHPSILSAGAIKFSVFGAFRLLFFPCYYFRWGVINSASSACFGCHLFRYLVVSS